MLKRLSCLLAFVAQGAFADQTLVDEAIETHILPSFALLNEQTAVLEEVARVHCTATAPELRSAFHKAFDSWVRASHLRLGPSEENERAFALAFWPDTKGFTPRSLNDLITNQDPAIYEPATFAELSIAARGFYALEFLLYDTTFLPSEEAGYHCDLVRAITHEIHRNSAGIYLGWQGFQETLRNPSLEGTFKDETETLREVFKVLIAGLQFTSDARLGRPLGTFDHPRPARAEARRSERSRQHVELSLRATYDLAVLLSQNEPLIQKRLIDAYDRAIELAQEMDDPTFANVADPSGRFRVEVLQQAVDRIREIITLELAPALGVTEGFNALDGD